jgi:chromosome segregation protein
LQSAQSAAVAQRDAVVQVQQSLSVLASEQRNIQEQSRQLSGRRERLSADRHALTQTDEVRLQDLQAQWELASAVAEESLERLHSLQESAPELDEARRLQQQQVNADAARYADVSARLEALKALQERLRTDEKLKPWLSKHGLVDLQGLWTRIQVQAGWENAVEAALRDRLGALEVSKLEMVQAFIQDLPPVKLSFFTRPLAGRGGASSTLAVLADKVQVHDAGLAAVLAEWLRGCFVAADIDQAFAQRDKLQAGETLFVPQGHAVDAHSVSFYAADAEQAGLLARAQEIQNLEKDVRAQAMMAEASRSALNRAESAYAQCAAQLVDVRRQAQESQTHSHSLQVEVLRLSQLAEQTRQRSSEIEADAAEVDVMLEDLAARSQEVETRFETLDIQLGESQQAHADLQERAMAAQAQLDQSREQLRSLERQVQEQMFNQRSLQAREQEIERSLQTADAQTVAVAEEVARGQGELQDLSDAAAQAGLQTVLALKAEREQALAAKRSAYEDLTATLRSHEERRLQLERELDPMRQRITDLQLKEQAARLGFEQYENQLFEAQADLDALAQSLEGTSIKLSALQAEIDRLHREIAALGAVNLAALDELTSSRERKEFLDAQSLDLNEAMSTLEDAIRKIDGETRELLAETFNEVNRHFGEMFPVLFGGGNARLVITGDEILDSGVQVIAQPPGKKNQTIHLLSGGEKALTAIALVFAIFQLNPAPFCLLDEVDAPLDDANTERYTRLVQRMSAGTQFLFISHNKIAMEMAEQLIGVTMQEQGVSRIVAVDMEAAVGLVEAA